MQIYKINFSLLTLFSLLIYIYCGRGLKGCAGCRQTEVQTNKQTNKQTISRGYAKELANRQTDESRTYAKNWRTKTKNRQGAGSANSGAYYIPVLTPDAVSGADSACVS